MPAATHSTLAGLTTEPDDPGYARDPDGRRYFLTHAADGGTVPIPVELTDEQRAELDASRDRVARYAARLADAERDSDAGAGDVVPLRPVPPAEPGSP